MRQRALADQATVLRSWFHVVPSYCCPEFAPKKRPRVIRLLGALTYSKTDDWCRTCLAESWCKRNFLNKAPYGSSPRNRKYKLNRRSPHKVLRKPINVEQKVRVTMLSLRIPKTGIVRADCLYLEARRGPPPGTRYAIKVDRVTRLGERLQVWHLPRDSRGCRRSRSAEPARAFSRPCVGAGPKLLMRAAIRPICPAAPAKPFQSRLCDAVDGGDRHACTRFRAHRIAVEALLSREQFGHCVEPECRRSAPKPNDLFR
jgi:hypothetical protein